MPGSFRVGIARSNRLGAGRTDRDQRIEIRFESAGMLILLVFMFVGVALASIQEDSLPDGSQRPGIRITIRAGHEREFLFRPEGVRFLSGRARIVALVRPFIDPVGR